MEHPWPSDCEPIGWDAGFANKTNVIFFHLRSLLCFNSYADLDDWATQGEPHYSTGIKFGALVLQFSV